MSKDKLTFFWGEKQDAMDAERLDLFWDLFSVAALLPDNILEHIITNGNDIHVADPENLTEQEHAEMERHIDENMFLELYASPRLVKLYYKDILLLEFFLDTDSLVDYFGMSKDDEDFILTAMFKTHKGYDAFIKGLDHAAEKI